MTEMEKGGAQIFTKDGRVDFISGDSQYAKAYVNQLAELYENNFVDPPLQGTYFYSKEQFRDRLLEDYIAGPKNGTNPSFKIVSAWIGDQLIGFASGASLPSGTQWWEGIKESLPERFNEEDGNRTLALLDIVVKRNLRSQGVGHQLHSKLLEGRGEERVTLMCSASRQPAYSIWQHWGYKKVGTTRSEGGEIVWDVLIRQLNRL